jgi:hypothetical protein
MALNWLLLMNRPLCKMIGHDWAAHRYEALDPNDIQICTRCGATKRGIATP